MKKTISVILFVGLVSTSLFGQFTTGTKSVGGGFSYTSLSNDGEDAGSIMIINPSVNYFVMDNMAVSVSLNMTTITPSEGDALTETGFGLGGYYHINNNIYAGGSYNSNTPDGGDASTSLNLRGGYLHGLSESVYLDVNGNYSMGMGDNKMGGMSLGVGVVAFF
jgi:hypothetical protein